MTPEELRKKIKLREAAPDLLEACKYVKRNAVKTEVKGLYQISQFALEKLCSAVTKATE